MDISHTIPTLLPGKTHGQEEIMMSKEPELQMATCYFTRDEGRGSYF